MEDFPGAKPPKTIDGNSFTDSTIYGLFIKFNSPLPSSAAIERLFSLGKVMLKPKRSSLTDEHFDTFERKRLNFFLSFAALNPTGWVGLSQQFLSFHCFHFSADQLEQWFLTFISLPNPYVILLWFEKIFLIFHSLGPFLFKLLDFVLVFIFELFFFFSPCPFSLVFFVH